MTDVTITLCSASDAPEITAMLARLADGLGDRSRFRSTPEIIAEQLKRARPLFQALVARADGTAVGLSLFFAHFSTLRAPPGVYVQDLWVAPSMRGAGLGARLLEATARQASNQWAAAYVTLSVDQRNTAAQHFYQRLGFCQNSRDLSMSLDGAGFERLAITAPKVEAHP